jgi:predicted TIM-barrel fold metal-dependent hydrolase
MKIIDAQVHIWNSGTSSGEHRKVSAFTAEEILQEMDAAGVDAALIHPPLSWDHACQDQAEAAATQWPDRFAILGQVPLDQPEASTRLLEGWRQRPGQKGLRYALVGAEDQRRPADGSMDWLWPVCEAHGLPVATMAWRFFPYFRSVAERHPGLRLIIDHCGLIRSAKGEPAFADIASLLALAKLPNVALKATGAPAYSVQPYPFRDIRDGLHRIYDAFGPDRFFWGTDITRMPCSWRECVTFFTEELPWLHGRELEKVMGSGLCDWIGWDYATVRGGPSGPAA